MEDNNQEELEMFSQLSATAQAIIPHYLDFFIYVFFLISLIAFITVALLKIEPFDKKIVKRYTLLTISTTGLLLFFQEYLYILYMFILIIIFLTVKVREEIRQFFLVMAYKRKELAIDLGDNERINVVLENVNDVYERFGFVKVLYMGKTFGQLLKKYLIHWNNTFFYFIIYFSFFSFVVLIIFIYILKLVYETKYLIFTS